MKKKKITADPTDPPKKNPYIDFEYIGEENSLKDQIMERFHAYERMRWLWDPYYYENLAFYSGRQYLQWNPALNALDLVLPVRPGYTQAASNLILGKCRMLISRLTGTQPTAQVLPNTGSDADRLAARACRKILQHNYFNNGYREEYIEAAAINVVEGNAWIETIWDECGGKAFVEYEMEPSMVQVQMEAQQEGETFDKELSEKLAGMEPEKEEQPQEAMPPQDGMPAPGGETPEMPENPAEMAQEENPLQKPEMEAMSIPELDDSGKQVMKPKIGPDGKPVILDTFFEGKVDKTAVGPFNMYYDMTCRRWKDVFDYVRTEFKTIDYVRNNIPNCSDIKEEDGEQQGPNPWENIFSMQVDMNPNNSKTGLTVYIYRCKSCEDFPEGLEVTIVKDKIRIARPMPVLRGERLPASFCKSIMIPGVMRGMSIVEHLKNPQTLRNKLLSQHIENAKLAETYRIMAQAGTQFSDVITTEAGVVLTYAQGVNPPTVMNMPQLPSTMMQLIDLMDQDMDIISGVSRVSQGVVPENITSGDMMEIATENDQAIHVPESETFNDMVADSCSLELRYMQAKCKREILIRFLGHNGKLITDKFKAAIIRNNFDVIVSQGRLGNNSRSVQRKNIETMLPIVTQGQGTPTQQKIIIDKSIDFMFGGEEEILVDEVNKQENYIRDIINDIQKSGDIPDFEVHPPPFVSFEVWEYELKNTMLDPDFKNWPEVCKDRMMGLWLEVSKKLEEMQLRANMLMGGPAGGGQPEQGPQAPTPPAGPKQTGPQDEA